MTESKELKDITMSEIAKHNTQEDCWLVIGNEKTGGPKVYDVTKYLDDHPGGAEVLLDVSGQDADEFFEDIGHSKDARDELANYLIGALKLDPEEIKRRQEEAEAKAAQGGAGGNLAVLGIAVAAVAFGYYKTQM